MNRSKVISAARQLRTCDNHSGAAVLCEKALRSDPDQLDLRLEYASALLSLGRDAEAQLQLGQCLRKQPQCGRAYRLLDELALRNDEINSAEIFLRESRRLDPDDSKALELLEIIPSSLNRLRRWKNSRRPPSLSIVF